MVLSSRKRTASSACAMAQRCGEVPRVLLSVACESFHPFTQLVAGPGRDFGLGLVLPGPASSSRQRKAVWGKRN